LGEYKHFPRLGSHFNS